MCKLHKLVQARNELINSVGNLDLTIPIQEKINQVANIKINYENIDSYLDKINLLYQDLIIKNQEILTALKQSIIQLEEKIDEVATALCDDTYKELYSEANFPKNINVKYGENLEEQIVSKISQYSDWHYPGLQINPREKKWIDCMTTSDPLYLTNHNINPVKKIIADYTEAYQHRLRLYEISDRDFSILPQNQFGFILCWDSFTYLSRDKIEKYISEIVNLLRPGGVFMFNYNNCDLADSAYVVDHQAGSYMSASLLKKILNQNGLEIINLIDLKTADTFYNYISLAEVKKPGSLGTIKMHPALGKILDK